MSHFNCEHCGALCADSPAGYISGCEHYPPDINTDERTPEEIAASFVAKGVLAIDPSGAVWRRKKKVGGNRGPRLIDVTPTRCDKRLPNGYRQIQVYIDGVRVTCSVHRLIWFLLNGEIPADCHIHHKNGERDDNRPENLERLSAFDHTALHGTGRPAWNKGLKYGESDAYRKSQTARAAGHRERVKETVDLWKSGASPASVAQVLGICTRQVYSRLRSRHAADYV